MGGGYIELPELPCGCYCKFLFKVLNSRPLSLLRYQVSRDQSLQEGMGSGVSSKAVSIAVTVCRWRTVKASLTFERLLDDLNGLEGLDGLDDGEWWRNGLGVSTNRGRAKYRTTAPISTTMDTPSGNRQDKCHQGLGLGMGMGDVDVDGDGDGDGGEVTM